VNVLVRFHAPGTADVLIDLVDDGSAHSDTTRVLGYMLEPGELP
jgi:hypothetical protein